VKDSKAGRQTAFNQSTVTAGVFPKPGTAMDEVDPIDFA
jgi:hypothetical protein